MLIEKTKGKLPALLSHKYGETWVAYHCQRPFPASMREMVSDSNSQSIPADNYETEVNLSTLYSVYLLVFNFLQ